MNRAGPFVAGIGLLVVVLAIVFARSWKSHREQPGALRRRALELWGKTGLHWSPRTYLTIHTAVALIATIAGLAIFSRLADWISDQAAITRFDVRFDDRLHAAATPIGIAIAQAFSFIGGPTAMAVLMFSGIVYLLVRRERTVLYGWLIAFIGGGALDWALKTIFHRDRPAFPKAFVHALGFSFPSGHSMGSLIGFGMLAYIIIHTVGDRRADILVGVVAGLIVLAVGFSRLYLGAHYPSDVLAGFAAGIVWLAACISAIEIAAPAPT
ncbi:MAG TPA: phosphatase PAP2 family protein [Gemmatimonadaceae bacterium]